MRPALPIVLALLLAPAVLAAAAQPSLSSFDDDAGSGRDAGADPATSAQILPETRYMATLHGRAGGDPADWFSFDGAIGQRLEVRATGAELCIEVLTPSLHPRVQAGCLLYNTVLGPIELNTSGTWHVAFSTPTIAGADLGPQQYSFGIGLDAPASAIADPVLDAVDVASAALGELTNATDPARPNRTVDEAAANAVIAVIDDGINPYHAAFRDDTLRARLHPSQYIVGYPLDAEPIQLTFGRATLTESIAADCAEWSKVRPGRLYWFPGTKIVGAIFLESDYTRRGEARPITCDNPERAPWGNLFGSGAHGTMTASRAVGNGYGACPSCRVVAVQGLGIEQLRWTANQSWIDLHSNSWGPYAYAYAPAESPDPALSYTWASPSFVRAVEETAQAKPAFWAAGNGIGGRAGVLGHPTQLAPHLGPSAIRVGGQDSGRVSLWTGSSPHVVSDACASWAALHESLNRSTPATGSGTSAATPFAAGIAGEILLAAREVYNDHLTGERDGAVAAGEPGLVPRGPLADGVFTREEWMQLTFHTANPRPQRVDEDGRPCSRLEEAPYLPLPIEWTTIPRGTWNVALVGYGALTPDTAEEAGRVLRGERQFPPRYFEDSWFARDAQLREAAYRAYVA